ncbi:MAG TPA: hypothetical protein VHN77_04355 [Phycisphaerales bacterium]|nr:hypothetical protein [Phycisphaerales bacterium]
MKPAPLTATHHRPHLYFGSIGLLGAVAAGSIAAGAMYVSAAEMWAGAAGTTTAETEVEATTAHEALVAARLTPPVLAAAGLDSAEASTIISSAQAYLAQGGVTMAVAFADHRNVASEVAKLQDAVVSGRATQEQVTQLASAKVELAQAEASRAAVLDAFTTAVTGVLTQGQRDTLETILAQSGTTIPPEYMVVARDEQERVQLRNALAARRIAERNGDSVPQEAASTLSTLESDNDVTSAIENVEANLAAIRSVWDQAFGPG